MNTNVVDSDSELGPQRPNKSSLRSMLIRVAFILAGGYLAILCTLAASETYLVYPGSKYPKGDWEPTGFDFKEVAFSSQDGTKLVGWYLPSSTSQEASGSNQTVLICHGNAENVSQSSRSNGDQFRDAIGADVFEFDYRGYGKSEGSPHEVGVLADAEAAMQWICEKTGKAPDQIILVGHSLGGGPAVHLANACGCKALILQRTFSSTADVGQLNYPWLPIRYVMRNQYRSSEKIKSCTQPLFQTHPGSDQVIPIELAQKLFEASPSKQKMFTTHEGLGHYDPPPRSYWRAIKRFVESVDSPTS